MKSDLISVVVPVYNARPFLREALESLRGQLGVEMEVLLVDDGSTDGSAAICREVCVADPRFRLITQANAGVSAARNHGIDEARGRWIAFMDADDVMLPGGLRAMLEAASASGAGIVAAGYTRKEPAQSLSQQAGMRTVSSAEAIRIGLYQKRILNNPWGMLFHRSVFGGADALRFRKCRYEDLDLFYQAFERVELVCLIDTAVYFYRDTPGSFLNSWTRSRLDVLDVTDRMLRHFTERGDAVLTRAAADRRFSAHFNILTEIFRRRMSDPETAERCWQVITTERRAELLDPGVRLKNKLGALVSYLGIRAIKVICKF